jgi:hypothetical protein
MNPNLTQYLSEVLRNEVAENISSESRVYETRVDYLNDQKKNQFLIDVKYALRLDEII